MKNFDKYSPGDVVLVKFPFSDLLNFKVRPAVVLKDQKDDLLLVPVSSKISGNKMVKQLKDTDLTGQKLPVQSVIRYTKLFTLNKRIVYKKLSALKQDSMSGLLETVLAYLKSKD
jgi:mRNA interferase MazF